MAIAAIGIAARSGCEAAPHGCC